MDIFLAILEDRHYDVQIEPFRDLAAAMQQILGWQAGYQHDVWEVSAGPWEYCTHSEGDDGPSMRIEKKAIVQ